MTDSRLATLQRHLDEREATLRDEVLAAREQRAERPSVQGPNVQDAVETGEERYRHGMEHVDLQRDQDELRAIAGARERISAGSYGECVDCGRPIPFERLEVQPTALRDVGCQAKWEKTHPTTPAFTV